MRAMVRVFLMAVFFCLLGFLAPAQCDEPSTSNVADLTADTFDDFIAANDFVLVEFFAPWCGHCKKLAPEWEKAADELKAMEVPARLAKVDCTQESKLAERFKIEGFPTLKWFKSGQIKEYTGGREAPSIVRWVKKASGPATVTLTTKEELDEIINKNDAVIGFFEKDSAEHKAFIEAALYPEINQFTFYDVVSQDLIKESGETVNTIRLYRPHGNPVTLDKEITAESVVMLVAAHGFPYFEHARNAWPRHLDRGLDYVLIIAGDQEEESWADIAKFATKLGEEFIDKIGVSWLGKEFFGSVTQFGLSGKTFPAAFILAPKREKNFPHDESVPITEESMRKFIAGVLDGTIAPKRKSAEPPESNDGPVTVLVGTTFDELVINNDKDVFVEFYAPWCGHCKSLAPIWDELGQKFSDNSNIVIAKMDSTANDNDHVSIRGFPTLVFFPAGSKDKPITYQGGRTLDDLAKFVEENATHKDKHDEL